MALRAKTRDPTTTEFHKTLDTLGLTQCRVARLFNVTPRNVRRWQHGDRRVPYGVGIVLRLLAARMVTVAQIEQVAVPVPAQTNSDAKPEPPVPLLIDGGAHACLRQRSGPAPKQSALARAKAATLADSSLSTAAKVIALASG